MKAPFRSDLRIYIFMKRLLLSLIWRRNEFHFWYRCCCKKEREVSIEKRYRLLLIFTTSYCDVNIRPLGSLTSLCICIFANSIHCLAKLVKVNKRSDNDTRSKYIPQPESRCSKVALDSPCTSLITNTLWHLVHPDNRIDTKCQPGEYKDHQAVVHCFLTVTSGSNGI